MKLVDTRPPKTIFRDHSQLPRDLIPDLKIELKINVSRLDTTSFSLRPFFFQQRRTWKFKKKKTKIRANETSKIILNSLLKILILLYFQRRRFSAGNRKLSGYKWWRETWRIISVFVSISCTFLFFFFFWPDVDERVVSIFLLKARLDEGGCRYFC